MSEIKLLIDRNERLVARLVDVWESAVRETHSFLSEDDIIALKPEVCQGLKAIDLLYGYSDDAGVVRGFIGIADQKIEMLFVDNDARGQGVGKQLFNYAIDKEDAQYVDVNEQNEQGVGFYLHMGLRIISRSELDEQGRPFPLLHLKLGTN